MKGENITMNALKFSRLALAAGTIAGGLAIGAPGSQANVIYTLTTANIVAPAPYGTVTVHLIDSNSAQITFDSNTANGIFFTDGGSAGVNSNGAATILAGSITGNALAGGPCPTGGAACYSDAGSGNEDGFGSFSNRVDTTDSFSNRSSTISFELDKTSGTWASEALVLADNASGNLAAAHIGICTAGCTAFSNTGFVTDGTTNVPEPASLAIFGTALAGLGLRGWRRNRQNPA